METLQNHKTQVSKRLLGFRKKMKLQNNRGAQHPKTRSTKSVCANKDTLNPTKKNLTAWHKKVDSRRAFVRNDLLQKLVQGRTTLCRRRQRHHKTKEHPEYNQVAQWKWKTWPKKPQSPLLNSGHRCPHGYGHFHQGFPGGILHHRRHGDSPNNLPHLMSQQLALNTNERTPAHRDLLRSDSDSVFFVK